MLKFPLPSFFIHRLKSITHAFYDSYVRVMGQVAFSGADVSSLSISHSLTSSFFAALEQQRRQKLRT